MGQLLLLGSWRALQPASLERAAPSMRIAAQRFQLCSTAQRGPRLCAALTHRCGAMPTCKK